MISEDFRQFTDPFRPELLVHCYRMLGSIHDAEDQLQETLIRAWRSYDRFDGRSSARTWLYRIATNECLRALAKRGRRPLPSGLGGPTADPNAPLITAVPETPWLQPIPDAMFDIDPVDPASVVVSRAGTRLALIAALQYLPARQRAVLILRDVLGWRAAEVAELLDMSTVAVNSALQRARTQLKDVTEDDVREPTDPDRRALLDQYATAFANADVTALMALLTEDVVLEMPPYLTWFTGRGAIGEFFTTVVFREPSQIRMVPTKANNQLAVVPYRGHDGVLRPHSIQVLTFAGAHIARITSFQDPALFPTFGLPPTLPALVGEVHAR
ncbi:MAG TPA: sigma-70 family RNA polymerase sigma factor [Pseudonocardiaceae bacterium]|nr:sigma-70 family RNA polymerase sigma factor [Pseudonocardiaceae bacterium]